jgi:vitamin B12 transporter
MRVCIAQGEPIMPIRHAGIRTGLLTGALAAAGVQAASSIETITVTATRIATAAERIPASVTVLDRDTIERSQSNDVGELLRGSTGIDMVRYGGPGQTTSLFLRGAESDHTLVLFDGVPINPGTIGNAALQNIDPRLVERIEIVRGPLSSLYGSAAMGGVINIITATDSGDGGRGHFAVQGGSFETLRLTAGAGWAEGPSDFALHLSHQSSAGFPAQAGDTFDSGFRNTSLTTGFGQDFGAHRLRLQAFGAKGNTEYSSFGMPLDQDFEDSVLSATLDSALRETWDSRLTLSRSIDFIDQQQANYLGQFDYAHTTRYRLDWQHDVRWHPEHTLVGGVLLEREDTAALSYGTGYDVGLDNQAVYLQDQFDSGPHAAVAALRLSHHDTFGDHVTWNLGYGYQFDPATRLRASLGTAFRAPSSTDLYGFGGNPDLDPETSRAVELGVHHQLTPHAGIDASLYHSKTDDLIVYDGVFPTGRNENVERASVTGLELGYDYLRGPWQLQLGIDWKRPRDQTHDTWLPRRARIGGKLAVLYRQADWDANLDVLYQGERRDSLFNDVVLSPYTLVNAMLRWHVTPATTLEGRIENLLDSDYELAGGYNTPDRSLYVGLRIESE